MIQMTEAVDARAYRRATETADARAATAAPADIEDLVSKKVMPPCLQGILTPVWLKNLDRLNAIHYLIDLWVMRATRLSPTCVATQSTTMPATERRLSPTTTI